MRSLRCSLLLLPFLAIWVSPLFAQTEEAARLLHAWGRFGEGSWTRVRVTNETIDANGNSVTTTTETTTTLSELGQDGYTLRVEVQVEVAGQTLSPKPQFITRGYNGEVEGQTVSVKSIGTGEIRIDNQSIPCELQQVTIDRGDTKVTSSVHVARDIMPFILKRSTVTTDAAGQSTNQETNVEVLEVNRPFRVLGQSRPTARIKTVQNSPFGNSVTQEVFSDQVPGGVVSHVSTQTDADGNVIRRSTLELLEYHAVPSVPPRRRLFGRRRVRT